LILDRLERITGEDKTMKRCPRCGITKHLDEFGVHKSGRQGYCKICAIEYNLLYRKAHPKYHAATMRDRYRDDPEARRRSLARNKATYARKQGNIKLGASCEICGSTDEIQFHHPNYDKPLEVMNLCYKCHRKLHAGMRRAEREVA